MDKKSQMVEFYNKNAKSWANEFNSYGARVNDIGETLALVKKDNPKVFEIGCGNGKDAQEICKRTDDYLGIDISRELILLAKQKVPEAKFEVADIEHYKLPNKIDAIFAFASLIHIPKEGLRDVFFRAFVALNDDGVFRLLLKSADKYSEVTKEDELGSRTFFLYSKNDINEMAKGFSVIKSDLNNERRWLDVLVQKSKE